MSTTANNMLIPVTGMTCSACAARIEKALGRTAGISRANVNFATEKADVEWDPAELDGGQVAELIRKAGFGVGEENFSFDVGGMTCAACAARIEKVLRKQPGVLEATVNFAIEIGVLDVAREIAHHVAVLIVAVVA